VVTAVVYARFSSELQTDRSIADQVRLCRRFIEQQGWEYQYAYTDRAVSGATARPAYQALLEDARRGSYDVVVAKALDRLSRDQEDVAGLLKRLRFAGIRLFTLAEGEIGELHVGLKGTMNALFLKDLAQKVRRGLEGRMREGRSGGGRCFGYDVAREFDGRGAPIHGGRSINDAEAAIVRRVFAEFADGSSPHAIAQRAHPRAAGVNVGTIDDLWQLAARHRHPEQRALNLLKCGACSGGFSKISQSHYGCSNARNRGTCGSLLTIRRDVLETSVLSGLKTHLMTPELAKEFAVEYHRELNRLNAVRAGKHERRARSSTVFSARSPRLSTQSRTGFARPA
jgi:DNA invertase Pin-like site-specific DNA recombinase